MAHNITAKAVCGTKTDVVNGDNVVTGAGLSFYADYADGRNEAWKLATPTLNVTMTVNAE